MTAVEVLFFGRLRAITATRSWHYSGAPNPTPRDVYSAACAVFPSLAGADAGVRVAVNEAYSGWDTPLGESDVVAFIPPVSGGRTTISVDLGERPIDVAALTDAVRGDGDGGVCTFSGHVRDNTDGEIVEALEYSAYETMAARVITAVAEHIRDRHGAGAVAVAHRLGRLAVGDVSIAVAVAAPHRAEAFSACHDIVDAIKAEAPIFKLEHRASGARWVEACR